MAKSPVIKGSSPFDEPFKWENSTQATQYTVAELGTADNEVDVNIVPSVWPMGVLQNDPKQGQAATVRTYGGSYAVAGASISKGDRLVAGAGGKVFTFTRDAVWGAASVFVLGTALDAASADLDIIGIYIEKTESEDTP